MGQRIMNRGKDGRRRRGSSYWVASITVVAMLSFLPAWAIVKASKVIDLGYIVIYLLLISMVTIYSYWSDKRNAIDRSWRVPERTLHLLELAGGWVAGFFAQRLFRHKISKRSYQVEFWVIAVIHQYVSLDFMSEWRYARLADHFIKLIFK